MVSPAGSTWDSYCWIGWCGRERVFRGMFYVFNSTGSVKRLWLAPTVVWKNSPSSLFIDFTKPLVSVLTTRTLSFNHHKSYCSTVSFSNLSFYWYRMLVGNPWTDVAADKIRYSDLSREIEQVFYRTSVYSLRFVNQLFLCHHDIDHHPRWMSVTERQSSCRISWPNQISLFCLTAASRGSWCP